MPSSQPVARVVLVLSALSGLLCYAALGLFPSPSTGRVRAADRDPSELVPRAYLPLLTWPPGPPEPELTIYDFDGTTERDWDWLVSTFGAVTLDHDTGSASVAVLRAIEGPSSLVIRVEDAEGTPRQNVPVIFHWPDAPDLAPEQAACGLTRGIIGYTNDRGEAGFGMGRGAYYFPPAGGPHSVWIAVDGTDCLRGMGMLGGTNHQHLDSVWVVP